MLSTAAFNAFLKTLEEPPKHVIFILATTWNSFSKKDRTDHLTDLLKNKTPKTLRFRGVIVESEGIEPSSIQAIEKPSTCLVFI